MTSEDTKKVAIIATDFFEESELIKPMQELRRAGILVDVIAPHAGEIKGVRHVNPGQAVEVDKTLDQVSPQEYDGAVFPGGAINSDKLRIISKAQNFAKSMLGAGKPVAVICHAPWLLVSAGLARGRKLTSFSTIQDDMRNAGAYWVDAEVVKDGNLITSRKPDDLPAFNRTIIEALGVKPGLSAARNM